MPDLGIYPRMANNLRAFREERGWSQDRMAEAMGTTRNMYVKLENGSRSLKQGWINKAANALGVDSGEIISTRPATVQVVGRVGAGAEAHFYAEAQGPFDEVEAPAGSTDTTVAVEVSGDSLGSLFDKTLVFYDDVRRPVTGDLIGKLCVVGLPDGRVLIKKITRSKAGRGLYHLAGQFGDPIMDTPIEWAARVKTMVPR